jgi:hypothetical protein
MKEEGENNFVLALNAAMCMYYTLSLFLISLFCCCSLSRYKNVPRERYIYNADHLYLTYSTLSLM